MTRRGWLLFLAMGVIWGFPYLFIKEAVDSISPAGVVSGRTLGAAVVLLPIAAAQGALRPALAKWPWVLAFAAIELAGPFMLLSHAEQTLPSGLTGLLVSTVPLAAAAIAFARGDRAAVSPVRVAGLLIGVLGVAFVVGGGGDGTVSALPVAEVLLTAVCYSIAPFIVATHLRDVPAFGSISLALTAAGLGYLPFWIVTQEGTPTGRSIAALVALTLLCTALAFVVFFRLIAEIGPARAPLITYVNPVVALALGVALLGEPMTLLMVLGIPLILIGCWLAANHEPPAPGGAPDGFEPADGTPPVAAVSGN